MTIVITEEEHKRLQDLYNKAQNTPVIAMSVKDGLEGRDFATLAWNEVRNYMDRLGEKYGYDPATHAVNKDREVVNL